MKSRCSCDDDVVVVFFGGNISFGATTGGVALVVTDEPVATIHVERETVHVAVVPVSKFSWKSESLSKISSSPVISCKAQVSSKVVPAISSATQEETSVWPLRENCVPMVVLENDLRSCKSELAALGLIKL